MGNGPPCLLSLLRCIFPTGYVVELHSDGTFGGEQEVRGVLPRGAPFCPQTKKWSLFTWEDEDLSGPTQETNREGVVESTGFTKRSHLLNLLHHKLRLPISVARPSDRPLICTDEQSPDNPRNG